MMVVMVVMVMMMMRTGTAMRRMMTHDVGQGCRHPSTRDPAPDRGQRRRSARDRSLGATVRVCVCACVRECVRRYEKEHKSWWINHGMMMMMMMSNINNHHTSYSYPLPAPPRPRISHTLTKSTATGEKSKACILVRGWSFWSFWSSCLCWWWCRMGKTVLPAPQPTSRMLKVSWSRR